MPASQSERIRLNVWYYGILGAESLRVPGDSGVWCDRHTGLVLAHRRLSILDPSPAGHYPIMFACERYVIAFNGEIYNHLNLRAQL